MVDADHAPAVLHPCGAVPQQTEAAHVVPVVEDPRQEVHVTLRDLGEHVPRHEGEAARDVGGLVRGEGRGHGDQLRQFQHAGAEIGVTREQHGGQVAAAAADIDQGAGAREIQAAERGSYRDSARAHGLGEAPHALGVPSVVERLASRPAGPLSFTRPQRVGERTPGLPPRAAEQLGESFLRSRRVPCQDLGERRRAEATARIFGEDPDARARAQRALEEVGPGFDMMALGQLARGEGAVLGEQVRDVQARDGRERLTDPGPRSISATIARGARPASAAVKPSRRGGRRSRR